MDKVFKTLNAINVNDHTEKKNNLTYLSWAWAWAEVKNVYPDAVYEIKKVDGKPYIYDEKLGYIVMTEMTIQGLTHEMWLPVMDGANKAMKDVSYNYKVKNQNFKWAKLNKEDGKYYDKYGNEQEEYIFKTVEAATMFDINTAIMRCLVKNIAMFGLGLYIYAGEDLPQEDVKENSGTQKEQDDIANSLIDEPKKKVLISTAKQKGVELVRVLERYNLNSVDEMTMDSWMKAMKVLEKMKDAEK